MFWLRVIGEQSAGHLARRLIVSAVKLSLTAEEVASGLAHTAEGITTPAVRGEAPEKSGNLRNSLRAHVTHGAAGMIVAMDAALDYASFVQEGTGIYHQPDPHEAWDVIGFQHMVIDGHDAYTMHSHHEGNRPNDFVGRGMARAEPAIRAALVAAGEQVWVSFAGSL